MRRIEKEGLYFGLGSKTGAVDFIKVFDGWKTSAEFYDVGKT